jgi:hypothetical protein
MTQHGIIVTNRVSCEEVGNDDANIRRVYISNDSGAENADNNDVGNSPEVLDCDGNVDNDDYENDHSTVDGECKNRCSD